MLGWMLLTESRSDFGLKTVDLLEGRALSTEESLRAVFGETSTSLVMGCDDRHKSNRCFVNCSYPIYSI